MTTTRENGGVVTQSQIDRAVRAHERLMKAWPELPKWREKKLDEWAAEGEPDHTVKSDVEKTGSIR